MDEKQQLLQQLDTATRLGDLELSKIISDKLTQLGQGEAMAQPPVDQGVVDQGAPVAAPVAQQQQFADMPSVPEAIPKPHFNPTLSPAQNLAAQTTGDNLWNTKIETALQEGKKNIWSNMADKTVKALYGDRYDTLGQLVKDAEVLPGMGTAPEMFFAKEWNPMTEKYENTWVGPTSTAGKMLSDPGFLETVGMIFGPAVHQAVTNLPQYRKFMAAPGPMKAMMIVPLMTTLGAITGGQISNMIRNGPWAKTELGTLSLEGEGYGSKAWNLMMGGDPNTLLGQGRTGAAWGFVPPVVVGGLIKGGKAGLAKMAGVDKASLPAVEAQLAAAERLSVMTPENVKAMTTAHEMRTQPWNVEMPWLEKVPGLGRSAVEKTLGYAGPSINLPRALRPAMPEKVPFTRGKYDMPASIKGPPRVETDPTGRLQAGQIGTELYAVARNAIVSAIQAGASLPVVGKYIKNTASYNSMASLLAMEKKLDLLGTGPKLGAGIGSERASELAVQGVRNWGRKRVNQESRLWDIYKDRAAKVTIPGQQAGHIVPTDEIKAVTEEMRLASARTPEMAPVKVGEAVEPMVYDAASVTQINKWASDWERVGKYTTVERADNLQKQVNETLQGFPDNAVAKKYALQYDKALKTALGEGIVKESQVLAKAMHPKTGGRDSFGNLPEVARELMHVGNMARASRRVGELNRTAFDTTAAQQFTKIDKDFFTSKALNDRWTGHGSKEATELMDYAFKTNNTQYMRTMREMMGKEGYNAGVRGYISDALNKSLDVVPMGTLRQKLSSFTGQGVNPRKLNLNTFQRELGLGGEMMPVEGRRQISEMLKLTGTGITPQSLDDLAMILSRYTVNFDLSSMAARRIPIGGMKGFLSALTAGLSKAAGSGAAGGVGGSMAGLGGVNGALSAITLLIGLNQIGRIASSDKVVRSLVRYVKNNEKMSASARGTQWRRRAQKGAFVKMITELATGPDKDVTEEAGSLYEAILEDADNAEYYFKYPGEALSTAAGAVQNVLR